MKAVIILAESCENLKPLTQVKPGEMLDIFDKPILGHLVEHLINQGIKELIFISPLASDAVKAYFENGEKLGIIIEYAAEIPELDEFLFIESPIITDIDIRSAIRQHNNNNRQASVLLSKKINAKGCQIIEIDGSYKVIGFDMLSDEVTSTNINTGIYILKKDFFLENPFFPTGFDPEKQAIYGINCEGDFFSVKSFDDYLSCAYNLLENEMNSPKTKNGVILGDNTFIEVGAKIKPPVYIGENTYIEKNAEIMPYSVIGKNSRIEEGARIENSIILNNVRIMKSCELSGCIIGGSSVIGQSAKLYTGSVVGEYTKIGKETVINPNVSVYNEKFIGNNLIVTENVVTGASEPEIKFTDGKITGDPTFDLTLDKAFKIGAVFGILNPGYPIGLFKDDSGSSEMIADSISAGLKSVGSIVYKFSNSLYNMCKTACSFYSLIGGIYIYNDDMSKTSVEFFSKDGSNVSMGIEEKLEEMLSQNEIPMVDPAKIPKTIQMASYKNYYYSDIVKKLEANRLSASIILERTSQSVIDYMRKMAVLYNLTLISSKKARTDNIIRAELSTSGKGLYLWDENNIKLSERQLTAIMAVILLEDITTDTYITTENSSEAVKILVSDMKIENVGKHISEQERGMLKIVNKEQFFMKNDAVYFLYKILFYLKDTKNTLSGLISTLPKTYFIDSMSTSPISFEAMTSGVATTENDEIYHNIRNIKDIKNKNK